jgi:steroid delta-isomerase-like uncharacterized protein
MAGGTEKTIKNMLEAWNSHDVEKILSFFADDCIYEDVAVGLVNHGKKEVKLFFESFFVDMPDVKFEGKSTLDSGNYFGIEWVMSGTFAHSSIPEMPQATGKKFSIKGVSIGEMREDKIIRNSDYWNFASFLQQVGLMPGAPK